MKHECDPLKWSAVTPRRFSLALFPNSVLIKRSAIIKSNLGRRSVCSLCHDRLFNCCGLFKKGVCRRRKKSKRASVTVKPLPVVASRDCGGFKRRRRFLLLLHPLFGQAEDTCEAAGHSSLRAETHTQKRRGRGKV